MKKRQAKKKYKQHYKPGSRKAVSQLTRSKGIDVSNFEQYMNPPMTGIESMKFDLQDIIKEANARIEALEASGYESYALRKAYEDMDARQKFTFDGLNSYEDILAEATRAYVFLMDRTSTLEGAELYTQQMSYYEYLGEFGNNYKTFEHNYKSYNTNIIRDEFARVAFKSYRMLEEYAAARIIEYGSENMIAAMYDLVVKNNYINPENTDELMDIAHQGENLLNKELGVEREAWDLAFNHHNKQISAMYNVVKARGKNFYEDYTF